MVVCFDMTFQKPYPLLTLYPISLPKSLWRSLKKLKINITQDLAIPLLRIYLEDYILLQK